MTDDPMTPPPSYDECPPQLTGGLFYAQSDIDGRWYAVRNVSTGELLRWPSNADVGLPEGPVAERRYAAHAGRLTSQS